MAYEKKGVPIFGPPCISMTKHHGMHEVVYSKPNMCTKSVY